MKLPRRLWGFGAIAAVAGAATALACGGSDGAAVSADDGGSGEGSAGDGNVSPDDSGGAFDAINGADAGCPLKADGPRSGRAAASLARAGVTGGLTWSAPANARDVDGQFATVTLGPEQGSELLRVTDFGFALPSTASIKGAVVELQRQASATGIVDGNVELWLDGHESARPKYVVTGWPTTIVGTHHYGQATDTWGDPLTPALVAAPGFGVELWARHQDDAGASSLEARVESLRLTLYYCE